jgi:PhzF family phenazine biosynthesis protein
MNPRRFIQCDVFSPTPVQGNGLAVVVDGEGLSDEAMAQFASWTNLAETTFLLPPTNAQADYKVRIWTTRHEMPFAGHPTLGSCAAWLHCGGTPRDAHVVRQECGVGIVEIDISGTVPAFAAPPTTVSDMDAAELESIVTTLDIPRESVLAASILNNGPQWQALHLDSAETVLAVDSSKVQGPTFEALGLIGTHRAGSECDYEVRMLQPSSEDPITGSLNAALAHWMHSDGRLKGEVRVAQGTCIGRHGRVTITPRDGQIYIGGETHILIEGSVRI